MIREWKRRKKVFLSPSKGCPKIMQKEFQSLNVTKKGGMTMTFHIPFLHQWRLLNSPTDNNELPELEAWNCRGLGLP